MTFVEEPQTPRWRKGNLEEVNMGTDVSNEYGEREERTHSIYKDLESIPQMWIGDTDYQDMRIENNPTRTDGWYKYARFKDVAKVGNGYRIQKHMREIRKQGFAGRTNAS